MRKSFIFVLALCICSLIFTPAFSSEVPDFKFSFPRSGRTTMNDWSAASAIVQAIQRPNIPAKEFKEMNSNGL